MLDFRFENITPMNHYSIYYAKSQREKKFIVSGIFIQFTSICRCRVRKFKGMIHIRNDQCFGTLPSNNNRCLESNEAKYLKNKIKNKSLNSSERDIITSEICIFYSSIIKHFPETKIFLLQS